ncbi:MAG: non-ribosomal peptide synthetase [Planctomycetota bacterium]
MGCCPTEAVLPLVGLTAERVIREGYKQLRNSECSTIAMLETPKSLEGLSAAEKRMLLAQLLREKAERDSSFPMSEGQKGLWLSHQMEPSNSCYNISLPSRFRSHLNVSALHETLRTLVQRHAGLRTTFAERDGELVQCVHDAMAVPLERIDASRWSEEELQRYLQAASAKPFDLARGPLLRAALFTRAPGDHVFLAMAHHIVVDFWSLVILLMEIRSVYPALCAGREAELPPVTSTYADFVRWQKRLLDSDKGEQLAQYWDNKLSGVPHVLDLPTTQPRPPQFSHRAGVVSCHLPETLTSELNDLAARERVTIYCVLLAAFQILLGRYSGQRDFLIGTPFVGRSQREFESTVGYFVNMLPMRVQLGGDPTFRELLRQVSATALEALDHQDYPFSLIVERLEVMRDPSRPALVQATFTLERSQRKEEAGRGRFLFPDSEAHVNIGGLIGETYYVAQQSCRHELEMVLEQSSGTINGLLCYCADLFDQPLMERMMEHYQTLLSSAVSNPDLPLSQLNWFSAAERQKVLHEWNQTEMDFPPNLLLHQLFEQQAEHSPDRVAITSESESFTYRQLDSHANRLAHQLIGHGVEADTLVALCLDRSPRCVALILATLKAGGACVPLDPSLPAERLQSVLRETGAVLAVAQPGQLEPLRAASGPSVISTDELEWSALQEQDPGPPENRARPDNLAYVIFTSGSTGHPKGVMVEHRAICNTIQWRKHVLPLEPNDRVLLLLPCFFDASFSIMFSTLAQGGRLVMAATGAELNPTTLLDFAISEQITVLPSSPRLLHVLVDHPLIQQLRSLRQVQVGGEVISAGFCQRIVDQLNLPLVNLYGPTEAAVETSCWICRPGDRLRNIPIGRPISNVKTYVLDANQKPVPVGVPGELYIAGAGLARGYLNDPRQTAERFLGDPSGNSGVPRMYRTGDRCRWLEDGNLEFLGRLDQQVKLRGYRIELAEVEHAMISHPMVREAAVAVHSSPAQEPRLVAYVVPSDQEHRLGEADLRRDLCAALPHYMVPTLFETLAALPRTASGKLDRPALPRPRQRDRRPRPAVPPRTPLEHFLVDACRKTLNIESVGLRDSFYGLGGSSIQGATLLAMLQEELGERIHTTALFDLTEIGELAAYLAEHYREAVALRFGPESASPAPIPATESQSLNANGQSAAGAPRPRDLIVPIQPHGENTPLIMVHPPGGIVVCYQPLAHCLGDEQPLYGVRARGLHGESDLPTDLVTMASEYVQAIRSVSPTGPYCLGGWSLGGVVAYEMAQQILRQGDSVRMLLLLDTTIPQGPANQQYCAEETNTGLEYGLDITLEELAELGPDQQLPYLWDHARKLGVIDETAPESLVQQVLDDLKKLFHLHFQLAGEYRIEPYPGRITLMRPSDAPVEIHTTPDRGWRKLARQVDVHFVPGQHHSMVKEPHVNVLARELSQCLRTPSHQ